tara:strand:- start:221 stop:769 length:549 start_codon:yes stop_codon:yes gene_type:complete
MLKKIIIIIFSFNYIFTANIFIDSQKSYIEYMGYHPLHNWIGKSTAIQSKIDCDDSNLSNCNIIIDVKADSFNSQNTNRDSNAIDVIEAYIYSNIKFESTSYAVKKDLNDTLIVDLHGSLIFHGIKKKISSELIVVKKENMIFGTSQFQINPTDFGIVLPTLLFVSIYDQIDIKVHLVGYYE